LPFGTGRKTASGVNAQGTVEYRSAARICRESPCAEGNGAYSHQVRKATELPRRGVASLMNGRRRRTHRALLSAQHFGHWCTGLWAQCTALRLNGTVEERKAPLRFLSGASYRFTSGKSAWMLDFGVAHRHTWRMVPEIRGRCAGREGVSDGRQGRASRAWQAPS
jgi:hypothetical protein